MRKPPHGGFDGFASKASPPQFIEALQIEMKILHIVPGLNEFGNGIAVAAKLIADAQEADLADAAHGLPSSAQLSQYDEIWVHSNWTPKVWTACLRALRAGVPLVRMPHGNLDPVRLRYHGWKKRLVGLIERYLYSRTSRVVVTCEAEKEWCREWGVRCPIEVTDIKRFFNFNHAERIEHVEGRPLHVLYLGRKHPLKGVEHLEKAADEINRDGKKMELKIVSDAFGEEKEKVWEWCDVLVLPTLSENFGLVVAEALERGKRVVTTDGAPAWGDGDDYGGRLTYLRGYRDANPTGRVAMLKDAILSLTANR